MRSDLDVASQSVLTASQVCGQPRFQFAAPGLVASVDQTLTSDYSTSTHKRQRHSPCFELAANTTVKDKPDLRYLVTHRPIAALSQIPRPAVLFTAGAVSGAIGKTLTAPLDRVKLLLQTSGGLQKGAVKHAVRKGGVWQALVAIGRTEGIRGYWKGNLPQVRPCVQSALTSCTCPTFLQVESGIAFDLHAVPLHVSTRWLLQLVAASILAKIA